MIRGNGSYELVFEIGRILVKRVEERDKCCSYFEGDKVGGVFIRDENGKICSKN